VVSGAEVHYFGVSRQLMTIAGTNVMIFLIFAEKFSEKLAFWTQNKAELLKEINHNIGI
jgi:hypothetical protein